MIIVPSTAVAGSTNYLPTQANFPGLVQYFPFTEATNTAGDNTASLTDAISGVVAKSSTGIGLLTQNADGTITIADEPFNVLSSGTIPAPGTKNVFVVYVGKPAAAASTITMGSIANVGDFGYRISAVAATVARCAAGGAGFLDAGSAPTAGSNAWAAYGMYIDFAATSTIDTSDYTGTTFTAKTQGTSADATVATGIATMTAAININTGSRPWGYYVMHLTNPLTAAEQKAAIAWAYYAAAVEGDKNKIIAPFLRGRT